MGVIDERFVGDLKNILIKKYMGSHHTITVTDAADTVEREIAEIIQLITEEANK